MAVETAASFLEVLEKSNLLSGDQLGVARDAAAHAADALSLARVLVQKELLTRWQAAQLLAGRTAFYWGKYKFVDLLGRGGMGSVFLAWHTMMNRPVALKVIARQLGQDPATLERFFTEARAVAALDHPNIVHAYDVANEGERYYLVMEYVEGRDLQRMVEAEGPLDFAQAVDYIRQAADGLAHAHSKDMIHCDIKPANLLVNRQGVVKLLDMGMARAVGRKRQITGSDATDKESQALVGTVDYMAPEQAMGDENLDRRADIYSLGCTFYFLLTGRPPFPEGSIAERIVKHQTQEPTDIAELRPDTPAELIRICRKMTAKDPADRFQTADELSEVLANWRPSQTKILRATPLDEKEEQKAAKDVKTVAGAESSRLKALMSRLVAGSRQWITNTLADRRRMMIAGGATIVVSVVLIVGMIWWALSSAKARRVRLAAEKAAAAQAKAEAAKKVNEFDGLKLAFEEPGTDQPAAPAPPAKSGPPPSAPVKGPPPAPGAAAPGPPPAKTPVATPAPKSLPPPTAAGPVPSGAAPVAPGPGAAGTPPAAAAKDAKTPAPATPAPATPAPATPASAAGTAAPATPASSTPAPTKPAAAPGPSAEKAPAPASPAPAPAGDLLQEFPSVVELPPIGEPDAGEFAPGPTLLGKIHGTPDQLVSVELVGKDTALKGRRQFTWEPQEIDKRPGWVVCLESLGKEEGKAEVARFWRDKGGLLFRWAEGAAKANGDYLRNCALEMRGGGPAHLVPLRKPEQVEPIVLDLQRGVSAGNVPVEFLPDVAHVRVEFTKVETDTGPIKLERTEGPTFQPAGPIPLKTAASFSYMRKDRRGQLRPGVEFGVTAVAKGKGLAITVKLVKPSAQQYKAFLAMVAAGRANAELEVRRISAEFAAAKEEADKAKAADKLEQYEGPLWFDDFYQQVHRKARLYFRVLIEAKDQRIELARTEAAK